MQKISSIHKPIQQILGSHVLNDHAHFWPGHPKIIEITTMQKPVHSIN